ncbi:unnamed protein product [Linum trigynum]|uniref:Aminotransferase-like plant mobile domain-containing protein n=1 Tax=Linum trigynum TaxID=586398 RepID=A0AAV2DBF4_9ROSI
MEEDLVSLCTKILPMDMVRHFMQIDIGNDLLVTMAERWRPETHMFHYPEEEITITLRDVVILTGLPERPSSTTRENLKKVGGH